MKTPIIVAVVLLHLFASELSSLPLPRFAVANLPTPVFSTADIPGIFGRNESRKLQLDRCAQLRELEFVALQGTVFEIVGVGAANGGQIYRITTSEYPSSKACFIDSRFVHLHEERPPERKKMLPDRKKVLQNLLLAEGVRYVWGGNVSRGIPELLTMYPTPEAISDELLARWELRGVDCSGLLYEATGGSTSRNTSDLVRFGSGVPIAGLTSGEIAARLKPLDLIVWNGHVLIVLDGSRVIESRLECGSSSGVVISPLRETLQGIMRRRVPVDLYEEKTGSGRDKFVVRRWYQ